jgi:hypothetical protein
MEALSTLNKMDALNTLNKMDALSTLNKMDSVNTLNKMEAVSAVNTRQAVYYIVPLRSVPATIVAVEKSKYYTTLVYVFVTLVILHSMRMCHVFICDQPRSTIIFYIIS